mgnify:CR=1 FL=1
MHDRVDDSIPGFFCSVRREFVLCGKVEKIFQVFLQKLLQERPVDLIVLLRIPDAGIGGDEGAQTERRAVRAHEIEPGDPGLQRSVDPVFHFRDLRDLPGVIIIFRKEYFPGVPGVQKLLRIFGRSFDQRLDV